MSDHNLAFDYNNIPLSTQKPDFKFPEFEVVKVYNSIDVYLYKDNTQALVNFKMLFHQGAYNETKQGLSLFTSNMLLKGTGKFTASEISEKIDMLGASISSGSRWDDSYININSLYDKLESALGLISECLFNSDFKEEEIERQKKKHVASILQEHSNSSYLAQVAFNSLIYKEKPYSNIRYGTIDSINSISRDDCLTQHESLLKAPVTILISGNFDKDHALKLIEKYFNRLNGNNQIELHNEAADFQGNKIVLIEKPQAQQTTLRIGRRSIQKSDPDYFRMQLVNCVFGGNFLSRLNSLLREEKGYTYGVHSSLSARKKASVFLVSTDINQEATAEAVSDVISEMQKISSSKVEKAESELCIQYILGTFIRSIETPQQINSLLQGIALFGLDYDYYDQYFNILSSLTPENIYPAQEKYLKPEGLVISAAGNISYLEKELSALGEIVICDKEGQITKA